MQSKLASSASTASGSHLSRLLPRMLFTVLAPVRHNLVRPVHHVKWAKQALMQLLVTRPAAAASHGSVLCTIGA